MSLTIDNLSCDDLHTLRRLITAYVLGRYVPSNCAVLIQRGAIVWGNSQQAERFSTSPFELESNAEVCNRVQVVRRGEAFVLAAVRDLTLDESEVLLRGRDVPVVFARRGRLIDVFPLSSIERDVTKSKTPSEQTDLFVAIPSAAPLVARAILRQRPSPRGLSS